MILRIMKSKYPADDKRRAKWIAAMVGGSEVSPRKLVEWLECIDAGGRVDIALDPVVANVLVDATINTELFTVELIREDSDSEELWQFPEYDFDTFMIMKNGASGNAACAVEFCRMVRDKEISLWKLK